MKITIKKAVFQKFHPKFKLALVLAEGIDNKTKLKESLHLLREAEQLVHLTFNQETLKNHHLISPWAVAQQEFGKAARHYHTSVERLLTRVLKRKKITSKNVLTNLLNYLALKHIIPVSVDDPVEIKGNLTFSVAGGKEKAGILRTLKPGALYYHDAQAVLGTKLDYWKNKRTALAPESVYALIHIEVLPPITGKELQIIVKEMRELIKIFCGGRTKVVVLDREKNEREI